MEALHLTWIAIGALFLESWARATYRHLSAERAPCDERARQNAPARGAK